MNKLSVKDRREQFLFLTGIFLLSLCLICYGIFHDFGAAKVISKEELITELAQDAEFERSVAEQRAIIDTAYRQIIVFNPNIQAVFLENDIKNSLGSVKSSYDRRAFDPRYKTFLQVSRLYGYLFVNRRELKGNYLDLSGLNKSLQDCKLSTQEIRRSIGSQPR
jgi:hypothetical protein